MKTELAENGLGWPGQAATTKNSNYTLLLWLFGCLFSNCLSRQSASHLLVYSVNLLCFSLSHLQQCSGVPWYSGGGAIKTTTTTTTISATTSNNNARNDNLTTDSRL